MAMHGILRWNRRHLRWLLCLALCLPLAQVAGAAHALSHLGAPAHSQRLDATAAGDACALCVVAASLGAGALPTAPCAPGVSAPPQPAPVLARHDLPALAPLPPANRGPPSLHA